MKKHHYRITVERLTEPDESAGASAPLQFEVGNHDDILGIIERIRSQGRFDPASAAAFGLGLKLFGETLLDNRDSPPFDAMMQHFGQFMKALKKGNASLPGGAQSENAARSAAQDQSRPT